MGSVSIRLVTVGVGIGFSIIETVSPAPPGGGVEGKREFEGGGGFTFWEFGGIRWVKVWEVIYVVYTCVLTECGKLGIGK